MQSLVQIELREADLRETGEDLQSAEVRLRCGGLILLPAAWSGCVSV